MRHVTFEKRACAGLCKNFYHTSAVMPMPLGGVGQPKTTLSG
jgi:hypothetical protein